MAAAYQYQSRPGPAPTSYWYKQIATVRPGSAGVRAAVRVFGTLALVLIALNLFAPAPPTLLERCFATAILASVAIPVWAWMSGADRTIPFMPFLALIYSYYYALSVFLCETYQTGILAEPVATRDIEHALGLALVGLYTLLFGYYGPVRYVLTPVLPRFRMEWHNERVVRPLGLAFSVGGLFFTASNFLAFLPRSLEQIGMFAAELSTVGICMLYALQVRGRLGRGARLGLWAVLIPARVAVGLASGLMTSGVVIAMAIALIYASLARRIPWKMIAVGTLVVFIVRPAEAPFRAATWYRGRMAQAGMVDKLELFGSIVYRITVGGAVQARTLIQFAGTRLGQFCVLADVMSKTPAQVPYWGGTSYYPMLFKPIPRALLPEKPEELSGQEFGHRYGLLDLDNSTTSINLPQLIEAYANFGVVGVIVGMFLAGLLYRAIIEMYVHPQMGLGALVGVVYISSRLFDIGSSTSIVLGGIPWSMVFIALIHIVVELTSLDSVALGLGARVN